MTSELRILPATGNFFLDCAIVDLSSLEDQLESKIHLKKGDRLDIDSQMYFPVDMLISLSFDLREGYTAEFRQIGREGFAGFSAFMGNPATGSSAVVQTSGSAYRVSASAMQDIFEMSPQFRKATLWYMQALMQEAAQSIICNRYHSIIQQYSRSLLLAFDRTGSESVHLTHEQIATTIGCRREAVSLVARKLQNIDAIDYKYGRIAIVNRSILEANACECYRVTRSAFSPLCAGRQTWDIIANDEGR
jgi:CRP-like cAMP-binding protein